jgi:hypothetical protein
MLSIFATNSESIDKSLHKIIDDLKNYDIAGIKKDKKIPQDSSKEESKHESK